MDDFGLNRWADRAMGAGRSGTGMFRSVRRALRPSDLPSVLPAAAAPVRALMSMPALSRGVGLTCRSILSSAAAFGYRTDLHTASCPYVPETRGLTVRTPVARVVQSLPYGVSGPILSDRVLHRSYLSDLQDGDIAYLWPSVPVEVHERVARRGNPIVVEAVNTLMSVAKPILDAAYDALGLVPGHGITEARIAGQEARYAIADAVMAPSAAAESALAGSRLEHRVIPTSYGTWVRPDIPFRPARRPNDTVTFLFVGTCCVRKGTHLLLDLWRRMPANARLRLVGDFEPELARLYGDVLDQPNVSHASFRTNVQVEYERADVFILPSLEEGDSIVTYEAASNALPVIASRIGAGRIGQQTGAIFTVDPQDTAAFEDAVTRFAQHDELRRSWGLWARRASESYDWSLVGPRAFDALHGYFGR
jgi:glycosyltransferase involved in cell wall biosynthesis